jgi:hypothetical protein
MIVLEVLLFMRMSTEKETHVMPPNQGGEDFQKTTLYDG